MRVQNEPPLHSGPELVTSYTDSSPLRLFEVTGSNRRGGQFLFVLLQELAKSL